MIIKNPLTTVKTGGYSVSSITLDDGTQELQIKGVDKFNLQAKTASPKTESQLITFDSGFDGLSSVEIDAVTSAIDSNITPTNIRAGVTVLGVQGNLEPDKPDQSKTVTPTTSSQTITADTGYELASVTINPVTSSIDSNITADNIKKDVTILGVTGTLEAIEPEPVTTSPSSFTIDGSTITGYVGNETDVTIPVSYSKETALGYSEGLYLYSGHYSLLSDIRDMSSMTFKYGSTILTFSSFDTLETDLSSNFPDACFLIHATANDPYAFSFLGDYYGNMISINGAVFDNGYDARKYINEAHATEIYFAGATIQQELISGNAYSITEISHGDRYSNYDRIKNITILKNIIRMIDNPFRGSSALETITVDERNSKYHSTGNCLIETASKTLITGCKNSVIPSDGSVTSIGEDAFNRCSGLTSITIPDSVTSIGFRAFISCGGLTSVVIGNGAISIGTYAFYYCTNLIEVTLGSGVTNINSLAFYGCSKLTAMTIKATTPPTLENTNAISTATTKIYIPKGTLSAYQSATNWSSFASKFVEMEA